MISRKAIKRFEQRSAPSLEAFKSLSTKELDTKLVEAKAAPWTSTPMIHQKVGVLAGLTSNVAYLLFDPGLGKSYTALQILRSRKALGQVRTALVLVPGVTNIGAWLEEIATHAPDLKAVGFHKLSKKAKDAALEQNHDIVVMTYMGWISVLEARARKGKRNIDLNYMSYIEQKFQMVIWDEADQLKNRTSLSTKLAFRLVKKLPYRLCLSGTPFDKNPIDLWSQFYLLDEGRALGETITMFRNTFCSPKYNPFSGGVDFLFNQRKTGLLTDRVKSVAIAYTEKECLDLPETVGGLLSPNFMLRPVPFPDENRKQYERIIHEIASTTSKSLLENVYVRLRQATSGFVAIKQDDVRAVVNFDKNPKLEALFEVLKEIPEEDKVIIFCEYKTSGALVCEALDKAKKKHVRVYSGTKDKVAAIDQFKQDPSTKILVGSRSICYGLNIQGANRIVMYESPDSTIKRQQLERRIRRKGQTKITYIYDIVVAGSIDVKILRCLRLGKNLFDEILASDDPTKLLA